MAFLDVRNVTFTYPGSAAPAVRDVSFSVERGEFVGVCGATGSGKSTLLRLLKKELTPLGDGSGEILLEGALLADMSGRESAQRIGYVMQRPEQQIVTDRVWHELAFGLENMGIAQSVIARRIAEMAAYFGIEGWFDRPVSELSGGQKQLLNLAAVMVMQPEVLILDEPTAQLDPIAAGEFISTVHKINRDLGLTVIIIEHRLEEIVPLCDRLLIMEDGKMRCFGAPADVIAQISGDAALMRGMPAAARLFHALGADGVCPLDVRGGRALVQAHLRGGYSPAPDVHRRRGEEALRFDGVYFRYEKNAPDVLDGLSLTVRAGEIMCIVGGNGSGKSTMLMAAAGLLRPHHGRISVFGRRLKEYKNQSLYRACMALLPQDVQTVFLCNTVAEELADARAEAAQLPFDVTLLLGRHPYDLSGGQQQLVALAKVLATRPKILLLDEPTKGLDAAAKHRLVQVLLQLKAQGMALLVVTHDVEFAAQCADVCAMFFRGRIVSEGAPREFFGGNSFYTTSVSRMTRGLCSGAVTVSDAVQLCRTSGEGSGA